VPQGVVQSISGPTARIATARGLVEAVTDPGIIVGDRVAIRNGRAMKIQSNSNAKVFYV
jgi:hypothetical protein